MHFRFAADVPHFWEEEGVAWAGAVVRFEELDELDCGGAVCFHGVRFRAVGEDQDVCVLQDGDCGAVVFVGPLFSEFEILDYGGEIGS